MYKEDCDWIIELEMQLQEKDIIELGLGFLVISYVVEVSTRR